MTIQQMKAKVRSVTDLSPTAREVTLSLPQPLVFSPGAFVNVFVTRLGKRERRAYSLSSDYRNQNEIALSIRRGTSENSLSPVFWEKGVEDLDVSIMGPLGLNTADKIHHPKVFLFGFGIGVSVVKSLAPYLLSQRTTQEVTVVLGSRTEEEVLYREFFEGLAAKDARLRVRFVVSRPDDTAYPYRGYIQDFVGDFDFNNSTVYLCGQGAACLSLRSVIEGTHPENVQFLTESFDS